MTHLEAIEVFNASSGSCLDHLESVLVIRNDQSLDLFLKVEQVGFGDRLDLS